MLRYISAQKIAVACAAPLRTGPSVINALHHYTQSTLCVPVRHKASTIRIANRKKVEMFVGKRYHLPTRLRVAAPDIAAEWDHEKNPMHLYPDIVSIGYMYPVYWKCRECANSYQMSVEKRVVRGGGCPVCEDRELNRSIALNTAVMDNGAAHSREADALSDGVRPPLLLPGEENRALRPKRSTILSLRTKY
ncbi:hypothetical protein LSCM1_02354 [Leishmania martiniquensis]|uniref:Treble clef zinc finger domain-containing protein n=1 Tax=Leishmania martiniquensis TaxID=1580590 RepID=A0A836G8A1_9TRYP|nr:hypothetical protein LSCM1_02354 [Leishmania martiniquensis]